MSSIPNIPEKLYKYRTWTNEYDKKVLTENQLYLASPKNFNDPYDCRLSIDYRLLNSPEKKRKYTNEVIMANFDKLREQNIDINVALQMHDYRLVNELNKIQTLDDKINSELTDNHLGVLSLSKRWNSLLMWAHYADKHKGFCVGFWGKNLVNSKIFGGGGAVNYDQYPKIDPLYDTMQKAACQTFFKATDWRYEGEYRLTKIFFPELPTNEKRIVKIPDEYFAEIYLGLLTPLPVKEEIIKIAREKKIKIYEIKQIPYSFDLDRKEI